eukprot:1088396-Amphidinium_carterae.1
MTARAVNGFCCNCVTSLPLGSLIKQRQEGRARSQLRLGHCQNEICTGAYLESIWVEPCGQCCSCSDNAKTTTKR